MSHRKFERESLLTLAFPCARRRPTVAEVAGVQHLGGCWDCHAWSSRGAHLHHSELHLLECLDNCAVDPHLGARSGVLEVLVMEQSAVERMSQMRGLGRVGSTSGVK